MVSPSDSPDTASKMKWRIVFWSCLKALSANLPGLWTKETGFELKGKGRLLSSTFVLLLCILGAIFIDERSVRLLPDSWLRDYLFDFTYVGKWELASLLATTVITIVYWFDQMGNHEEIERHFLLAANLCLFLAVSFLVLAIIGIFEAIAHPNWLYWHFGAVCCVAVTFFLNDLFTWQGMEAKEALLAEKQKGLALALLEAERCLTATNGNQEGLKPLRDLLDNTGDTITLIQSHKSESRNGVLVVDIPMCLAFFCLGLFLIVHYQEHMFYQQHFAMVPWHADFQRSVPVNRPKIVNIWASKEYFVGGAIAFQFLVSAITYVLIAARVVATEPRVSAT
jgi:hypothetical protein